MQKRREAEYYQNPNGSFYKKETIYIKEGDIEKVLMETIDGRLENGATKLSPRDYEEALQISIIAAKRDDIDKKAKKLQKKQAAVKELEKLGLTKESAKLIVYG